MKSCCSKPESGKILLELADTNFESFVSFLVEEEVVVDHLVEVEEEHFQEEVVVDC